MIFPLWRFWTFTPLQFGAAALWNCSEIIGKPCPFGATLFGVIMGAKGRRNGK